MSSTNSMTTAAACDGDLYAVLVCPSCNGLMVHAEAMKSPEFRAALDGEWVEFIQLSHTEEPAADGGRLAALEGDECNHARGRAPWTPPSGTTVYRIGKFAAYRLPYSNIQQQRRDQQQERRASLGG
jgi:hypothetical protein